MNNNQKRNKLVFEATPEVLKYLHQLWQSGELSEILGVSVLDVKAQPDTEQLERIIELNWLPWQELKSQLTKIFMPPQFAFRDVHDDQEILELIHLLHNSQNKEERLKYIQHLGEIGKGNLQATNVLIELLNNNQDADTFWETIISLENCHPNHPQAAKRKAKLVNLKTSCEDYSLIVNVNTVSKPDNKIAVLIRVFCADEQKPLPPSLKLALLSSQGETKKEVQAKSNSQGQGIDTILQMGFVPPSSEFGIKISVDDTEFFENITVD